MRFRCAKCNGCLRWEPVLYQEQQDLVCINCGARPMVVLREPPPDMRGRRSVQGMGTRLPNPVAIRRGDT